MELITLSGFVGTPDYASPEQLNEQTVDSASDIYSLGVTLWFLLTGRQPFRGPMAQVMAKHLQSPPPFDELQNLPRGVVTLLAHMLEKDPAKRPPRPPIWPRRSNNVWRRSKEKLRGSRRLTLINPGATALPELKKMSAAREPAAQRPARQFFLAEVLIGAAIAVIIYLVLSRPVEGPQPLRNQRSQARRRKVRLRLPRPAQKESSE